MKTALKLLLVGIVFTGVVFAQSHIYRQIVRKDIPQTEGFLWYTWDIYKMASPSDYLTESSTGSGTPAGGTFLRWFAEAGNFEHAWVNGDTICIIASIDTNETAFEHIGFYWLFSDTMNATEDPDTWTPDDTLRVMESAVVSATARANLDVEITNPYETDRAPWGTEEYDVLGFWVIADTTATGTPAAYDVDLGFIAVNGGPGGTTTFSYDTDVAYYPGFAKSTYHSYYIVARPETTVTPGVIPGFSTPHMAANSNLYTFGVEEFGDEQVTQSLSAAPNPFTQSATISYSLAKSSNVRLTVYNTAGQVVETLVNDVQPAGRYSIDYDGVSLPSGIYFYRLNTADNNVTKSLIKVN
jgi:hypothetical protein